MKHGYKRRQGMIRISRLLPKEILISRSDRLIPTTILISLNFVLIGGHTLWPAIK